MAAAVEPALGALVPEHVLTTAGLRRQEREFLLRAVEDGVVSMADCVLESSSPPALMLLFLGLAVHGCAVARMATKQLVDAEPFVTCAAAHVTVQGVQLVALACAAILGNNHLTLLFIGRTNDIVQPRRIFLLALLALVEYAIVLPLVAPTLENGAPPAMPRWCAIDATVPDGADGHHTLVDLLCKIVFAQCAYLIGMSSSIAVLLLAGLALRAPARRLLPVGGLVTVTLTSATYAYLRWGRAASNALTKQIALFDRCTALAFATVVDAATGDATAAALQGGDSA